MVVRERILKKLRRYYDSESIKVIIGPRRCGKTVLLGQIAEELSSRGVPQERIVRISFESGRSMHFLNDGKAFYEHIASLITTGVKTYLFCDEIQMMEGFETIINAVQVDFPVSIFLTGSNSKILSGELATYLGGRTLQFRLSPFSFQEYLEYKKSTGVEQRLQEYITWGGFPMVCRGLDDEDRRFQLQNLKDSIFLRDILLRNHVTATESIERILSYVVGNTSSTISVRNMKKELEQEGLTISKDKIYEYLTYYTQSMIVNRVKRYDIRGKQMLQTQEKYYCCDLGFFQLYKNRIKDEMNLISETLVYNELIVRGYRVYIGKTYKGEIDFIIENESGRAYVQVAYILADQKTRDREFGAFSSIQDNLPKYVISFDPLRSDMAGIRHIGMLEFLLGYELT
jgi:uncharacterized protein